MSDYDDFAVQARLLRLREARIGLGISVAALLFALLVIPNGVETPASVSNFPLSPGFLPYLATGLIFAFGLVHAVASFGLDASEIPAQSGTRSRRRHWALRGAVFAACLGAYLYLPGVLGMVGTAVIVTAVLMILSGERSLLMLILASLVIPVLTFLLFTRLAQVPLPLSPIG